MLGKLLIRYLSRYRWLLVAILLFQAASAVATLYLPRLNADIINLGVARGDTGFIWSRGGLMLVISLGQIVASIIATYFAARAAMAAGRDIRLDVFERVSGFSERELSQFGAGSLITRNTNDVQQVQMLAMMGATMLVSALCWPSAASSWPAARRRAQLAHRGGRARPGDRGRAHHRADGPAVPQLPDQARRREPRHARAAHRRARRARLRPRAHRRRALPRGEHRHPRRRPQGRFALRAAVPPRDARPERHGGGRHLVRWHPGRRRRVEIGTCSPSSSTWRRSWAACSWPAS